jgi:hypothetical protein
MWKLLRDRGPWPVYGFHPIKNIRNCSRRILRRFFANFCREIGCENNLMYIYIFRFVKYLSTFFYTSFPAHYHNKCLDINWSRLLRSAILSLWYSCLEVMWLLRDHLREKHVFGLFTFYPKFCTAIFYLK